MPCTHVQTDMFRVGDTGHARGVFSYLDAFNDELVLSRAGKLGLVVRDGLDLGGRGTLGVEAVVEPVNGELLGQLDTDDTLAHAEDLGVVA